MRMVPRPMSAGMIPVTASPPLQAKQAMLEDKPQGGPRAAFDEFREQKRHVVVCQFVGRRISVEGRQEAARQVLAAAGPC